MSVVTSAILHFEGDDRFLQIVNEFFERRQTGFVFVKDSRLPEAWYGGNKYLECDLAIGAFDHLALDGLVKHLRVVNQASGRHGYCFNSS